MTPFAMKGKNVWGTELTRKGIKMACDSAEECCGVGCPRCVWELIWIIKQLTKKLRLQ
jgi:hypothetical protein